MHKNINPIPVGGGGIFPTLKTFKVLIYQAIFPTVNNASNSINVWIIAKLLMKYVTCS